LKQQSFGTKFSVIFLRARMTRAELQPIDGKAFFARSVDKGWLAGSSFGELGEAHVTGDTATIDMVAFGRPSGMTLPFIAENGTWRFRDSEFGKLADHGSHQIMEQSKLPEDEWLMRAIGK